jgi:aryl-alcohol dehydrogenase-like predicted oxidoreductase
MATAAGTNRYFDSHRFSVSPPFLPRALGRTQWKIAPVGFGGYRVDSDVDAHRDALKLALRSGCNLIDTSTNYTDGHSEKLVGAVLKSLFAAGELQRDEVVVVSKVGYVQSSNLELAKQREARKLAFADMVKISDDLWHCIGADFLRDQIGRSLARLELTQIDALLLHNPEYFLKTSSDHTEYYARIKKAFLHLETEVAAGRIQYYGISSNTFPDDREESDFTSLQVVLGIAKEVKAETGACHFAIIQFPFNLYEPDAALNPNQASENGETETLLSLAKREGLGTLINRPLNAFYGPKLIRLADFPSHEDRDVEESLKEAFLDALQVETDYPAKKIYPAKNIAWAHILRENFEKIHDLEGWKNILAYQIEPAIDEAQTALNEHPEFGAWVDSYIEHCRRLFNAITDYLEEITSMLSRKIARLMDDTVPALKTSRTLSQKVIRVYQSLPGVDCVLVGMRKEEYVADCLALQPALKAEQALSVLEAVQRDIEEGAK